jgi:hypothetical protein
VGIQGYGYSDGDGEVQATFRPTFQFRRDMKFRINPYLELYGSVGSKRDLDGSPYWIIDNRVYGGPGVVFAHVSNRERTRYFADVGYFADTFTGPFLRISGGLTTNLGPFWFITGSFDYFEQDLYYSNGFTLQLRHVLR